MLCHRGLRGNEKRKKLGQLNTSVAVCIVGDSLESIQPILFDGNLNISSDLRSGETIHNSIITDWDNRIAGNFTLLSNQNMERKENVHYVDVTKSPATCSSLLVREDLWPQSSVNFSLWLLVKAEGSHIPNEWCGKKTFDSYLSFACTFNKTGTKPSFS